MIRPPNVIVGTTDGGSRNYLTILASSQYNRTTVQCFAFIVTSEGQTTEESPIVSLLVQGMVLSSKFACNDAFDPFLSLPYVYTRTHSSLT